VIAAVHIEIGAVDVEVDESLVGGDVRPRFRHARLMVGREGGEVRAGFAPLELAAGEQERAEPQRDAALLHRVRAATMSSW
jgi:hypothetical protein